jgi:dolichol-phosphate mannosyltransferase
MSLPALEAQPVQPVLHSAASPIVLSVVIPTFNEAPNVRELVSRLDATLQGIAWEAIFVDDNSPDGTAAAAKALAAGDDRVRCIRRLGRRGLASACIEGIMSSAATYVVVIDADLQHDERILPRMLSLLESDSADIVIGSRYVPGGSADAFAASRASFSKLANRIAQMLLGVSVSDPMSGFFMMRRDRFEQVAGELSSIGFKILLDIMVTARGHLRVVEVPYEFRARLFGESKFDAQIGLEFLGLILAKLTRGVVDPRFISFALVGTVGLAVHLLALLAVLRLGTQNFPIAQSIATLAALASNFLLNNMLTYRDRRLSGLNLLWGFFGFCAIGAVGAVSNVGIASWLYSEHSVWWLAGAAGALMGALWNYSMSSQFVWRTR